MEDKNILNDKELQPVNGGAEVNVDRVLARNITGQYVVTCEDNNEVIQGREWVEKMINGQ